MKHAYIRFVLPAVILFTAVFIFSQCTEEPSASLPQTVDFNFHIRPILVQNCYLCHGPDPGSREADLRLDTFEGATALREGGLKAVFPEHPERSEVIKRITHHDPDEMMPPPASNLTLSSEEKTLLKKWIRQGAEWKPHWAFIRPVAPEIPGVTNTEEVANEIDAFILEKLEQNHLDPASPASKNTLIRRLSYILTGLPPQPEDVEKFMADESPGAYEKMVDQYLNATSFGERWARHWMDVVRYAETRGHEFDYPVQGAWRYRDYLIRAFNDDLPYDQLVREHLAGDLLETPRWNDMNGSNESILGTVFYTMTEGKHSPVDLKMDEADRIDNMIDVTAKTFQALTVSCARCHDHKFDPIPATDYYALYGVMESSRFSVQPATLTLSEMDDIQELQEIKSTVRRLLASEWAGEEVPADREKLLSSNDTLAKTNESYRIIGDFRGQYLNGWKSDGFAFGNYTTLGEPVFDREGRQLISLSEGKASSRQLATGIFGALRSPDFTIEKDFIGVRALGKESTIRIIIDNFQLIQYPIYGELEQRVDKQDWQHYKFDVSSWKGRKAYIEIIPGFYEKHAYKLPSTSFIEASYAIAYDGDWPGLPEPVGLAGRGLTEAIKSWSSHSSSAVEVRRLNQALRKRVLKSRHPEAQKLYQKGQKIATRFADTSYFAGITEGFGTNSPVFIRGDYKNMSEQAVPRRFLSAVPAKDTVFQSQGSGRRELAAAILSPDNPLTSRVMVNRIWHHLFGRGIVETVDNFGLQGKLPTHPELLDFLAIKFQEEGWSARKMIKYIVMSNTFRRSVVGGAKLQSADPENKWLAHFPLRRLEAEAIRDGILAVSGNLDLTMFGAPVPVYLTDFMQGRGRPEKSGPLDGDRRRSIYIEVRRNFLSPMMLAFDKPIPFSTFGKRNVTNVPAQSLILMNDPFIAAQAEIMAENIVKQKSLKLDDKIQWVYMRAFARLANEYEIDRAKAFLLSQAQVYGIDKQDLLNDAKVWKDYCHSIFNLKEFIYLI